MIRLLSILTILTLAMLLAASPFRSASALDPLVFAVQEALTDEGYQAGRADGVIGPRTRSAIQAYETDYGLPLTGSVSPSLLHALGLAAYASELAGSGVEAQRQLAPIKLIPPPVVSEDASVDTDVEAKMAEEKAADGQPLGERVPVRIAQVESKIPSVEARFAPRNWLVRDLGSGDQQGVAAFGVFLEEGGSVVGPRFAKRLRWEADGVRFAMTYRNSIGQEVRRTGKLNGLNRIEGEAVGPDGKIWRWVAEAKPL